jgi:hypothetical protein
MSASAALGDLIPLVTPAWVYQATQVAFVAFLVMLPLGVGMLTFCVYKSIHDDRASVRRALRIINILYPPTVTPRPVTTRDRHGRVVRHVRAEVVIDQPRQLPQRPTGDRHGAES